MSKISEKVVNEIIKQGMIKLADPTESTVFVWNRNCMDQLDAVIRDAIQSCEHPSALVYSLGEHWQWCEKCGSCRRRFASGSKAEWQQPTVC